MITASILGRRPTVLFVKHCTKKSRATTRPVSFGTCRSCLVRPQKQQPIQLRRRSLSTTTTRQKATLASSGNQSQRSSRLDFLVSKQSLEAILRKPRTVPVPRWISPQHYTITLSECLGHSSFILVAMSYSVDDFLTLRIIAVAGATAMLFFSYYHPHGRVLWLPFNWNVLFIAINSYRIGRVYLDRYYAETLDQDFIDFRNRNFYLMEKTDYAKLVQAGTVKEYREGDLVVAQGEDNSRIGLVLSGNLKVFRDGELTYMLEEANFVSESGLHAGLLLPGKIESCATIVADSKARVLTWDRTALVDLMQSNSGVRRSLKAILSWDIVRKLKGQRELLASGMIDDPEAWTQRRNRQTQHRYNAILYNILNHPEYLTETRKQLDKYRMIHHIDDDTHARALDEIGWTPSEFEAGHKDGGSPWAPTEYDHYNIRSLLRMTYLRVFGPGRYFE